MKATIIAIIVSAVLTGSSQARLGETYEECVDRYGKPNLKDIFHKAPFTIYVLKRDAEGKCIDICYVKTVEGSGPPLAASELEVFMAANGNAQKWIEVGETRVERPDDKSIWAIPRQRKIWKTADESAIAILNLENKYLYFMTPARYKAKLEEEQQKHNPSRKGF